jgi:hypothetical protein
MEIEFAHTAGDILATEPFGGTFRDELVAGAMETPAANSELIPSFRHGVTHRRFGCPLVERGFEQTDQRDPGHSLRKQSDAGDVGRVVSRGDIVEGFHGLDDLLVESHAAADAAGDHWLESHRGKVLFVLDGTRLLELGQAIFNRAGVIGDTLKPATGDDPLLIASEIVQAILERCGTKIGNEDFHRAAGQERTRPVTVATCRDQPGSRAAGG